MTLLPSSSLPQRLLALRRRGDELFQQGTSWASWSMLSCRPLGLAPAPPGFLRRSFQVRRHHQQGPRAADVEAPTPPCRPRPAYVRVAARASAPAFRDSGSCRTVWRAVAATLAERGVQVARRWSLCSWFASALCNGYGRHGLYDLRLWAGYLRASRRSRRLERLYRALRPVPPAERGPGIIASAQVSNHDYGDEELSAFAQSSCGTDLSQTVLISGLL